MDEAEINRIVNQVVERIWQQLLSAAPKRKVLVLFSGASSGFLVGMQTIRLLTHSGHALTVVLTDSARQVIGEDHVRAAGAERILTSQEWVNTPGLVRESELVLVPTLSMNTAAHLALGLMNSMAASLILGSLLAGKPVVAICDGANPYGNGARVFSDRVDTAPELRKKLAENLMALAGFGMELVGEQAFLAAVVGHLSNEQSIQTPSPTEQTKTYVASDNIITAADLSGYPHGATVRLPREARLSPLAQETVGRLELRLIYEKSEVRQ